MDPNKLGFEEQTFQQLRPMAIAMGTLSAVVFLIAVVMGEQLLNVRAPQLYAYGAISAMGALLLWRARNLTQLWIGGTGAMVGVAMGYSTLVATLGNPDLWFFSTGLSLTFAVIGTFHSVRHYVVSTTLVWLVVIGVRLPTFGTPFDVALGIMVVVVAVATGSFSILLLGRARRAAYDLQQTLYHLAHVDALTQLPNRRAFMEALQGTVAAAPGGVALLMLDVDDFKAINDALGHEAGDQALIAVGRAIAQHAGPHDHGRIGGEEFAVLLRTPDAAQATQLAAQLVAAIHALAVQGAQLSVSIGVAHGQPGEPPSQLLRRADEALYAAKRAGKNQYRVA